MNNYHVIVPSGTCHDFEGYSRELCFLRTDCFPTPDEILYSNEGEDWNCNLCQTDEEYQLPVVAGDKFMFQLQFVDQYNPDPENPAAGWGNFVTGELIDETGSVISSLYTDFASRYFVGWNGTNAFQVIEIDTSKAIFTGVECFQFRFKAFDNLAVETDKVVTQDFVFAGSCDNTLLIKGHYRKRDCYNQFYDYPVAYFGSGSFKYENTLRFWANIKQRNISIEKTLVVNNVVQTEIDDVYRMTPERKFPPYVHNYLSKVLLGSEDLFIDGIEYELDSFSSDNQVNNSNMFFYYVDVTREFDKDFRC